MLKKIVLAPVVLFLLSGCDLMLSGDTMTVTENPGVTTVYDESAVDPMIMASTDTATDTTVILLTSGIDIQSQTANTMLAITYANSTGNVLSALYTTNGSAVSPTVYGAVDVGTVTATVTATDDGETVTGSFSIPGMTDSVSSMDLSGDFNITLEAPGTVAAPVL